MDLENNLQTQWIELTGTTNLILEGDVWSQWGQINTNFNFDFFIHNEKDTSFAKPDYITGASYWKEISFLRSVLQRTS